MSGQQGIDLVSDKATLYGLCSETQLHAVPDDLSRAVGDTSACTCLPNGSCLAIVDLDLEVLPPAVVAERVATVHRARLWRLHVRIAYLTCDHGRFCPNSSCGRSTGIMSNVTSVGGEA